MVASGAASRGDQHSFFGFRLGALNCSRSSFLWLRTISLKLLGYFSFKTSPKTTLHLIS
ncbi:hypothetical protein M407DRAFT_241562 [Tulasnella calospora MUT 4182]|uniref:Uncharacterized protein n=1 Tax=Tulasnella calospora MUT 4182 TaxID=1051891 RepID=A0A0C3MEF1_9AGAM|nr:hypothetical protein M407DRAFT_241562 [Tulasnella calospora MUT 4182]